ncbi:hypothetical protein [Streptomyces sp. ISL-11]|uniref:hypothetical protein n=1 Tax=Streptomyces sp. ISL-11 TaxID=2819174 RepID=UPI001BE60F70|nr:hypothetical protein [Streptomyces sp. ISL-11]MBT2385668.1 hypothetical protein [Streptomyces sp. ISL-11]
MTTVRLYLAEDVALVRMVHPEVDRRAVHTVAAGRRSPLAALAQVAGGWDTVLLAGVGRAAVMNWRRQHEDFPDPMGGTDVRPQFDRRAAMDWLLAPGTIAVPTGMPAASLVVAGAVRTGSASMTHGWSRRRRGREGPVVRLVHR